MTEIEKKLRGELLHAKVRIAALENEVQELAQELEDCSLAITRGPDLEELDF